MDQLIEALQILRKYGNPSSPTWCEHDTMHFCINPELVSDEDKKKLEELDVLCNEDEEDFYSFRYGSA